MELDMTKGRPLPIILKFLLPILIGNVFQQLYNMVDTLIVGQTVGSGALAAVGSTGTIMFLLIGLAQGLSAGFTVLTSQCFGAGDESGVRESVSNAVLLTVISVVILTVLSVLTMQPLLKLMNTPEDIFQDAYTYIIIICIGLFASVFYNLSASLLRAVGNSRVPLYFLIFSAILNVGLDLLLIIQFHMGVAGAAWATVIAQAISALLGFIYIYKKTPILCPHRNEWHMRRDFTRHQLKVGIPMCLQFAITSSGTMVMQTAINLFGTSAVAAFTAASKLQNLITQGMPSLGQAMATYSGQNYGKMDVDRIRKGMRTAIMLCVIYALISSVLVYLLMPSTIGLFFSGDIALSELMPWAKQYLHLTILFYIPLSLIYIFRNTMQGCGYGLLPMLGGVIEMVARVVVAIIAMQQMNFLLACACDPAAWTAACLYTGIAYIFVIRKIERTAKQTEI